MKQRYGYIAALKGGSPPPVATPAFGLGLAHGAWPRPSWRGAHVTEKPVKVSSAILTPHFMKYCEKKCKNTVKNLWNNMKWLVKCSLWNRFFPLWNKKVKNNLFHIISYHFMFHVMKMNEIICEKNHETEWEKQWKSCECFLFSVFFMIWPLMACTR